MNEFDQARASSDLVISVRNVSIAYKLYAKPVDMLKEALLGGVRHDTFWALRDVSLSVREGERLGIIGHNGAGKTTLLQVIAGNLKPTTGEAEINGRISSLLSMTPAWNPEETGLQNARFNLLMQGVPEPRIPELVEEIIDFTELGAFIHHPVKTYSSGMCARLMFAIATAIEPDILIIDEVLGAGDGYFAGKAARRMQQFCARGRALLFVSHATNAVRMMCDTGVWVENGEVRARGPVDTIVRQYEADILDRQDEALREGNRRRLAAQRQLVTPGDLCGGRVLRMRIRPQTADPRISGTHHIRNIFVKLGNEAVDVPLEAVDIDDARVVAALDIHSCEWGRLSQRRGVTCRTLLPRIGRRCGGHFILKWPVRDTAEPLVTEVSFEVASEGAEEHLTIDYVDVTAVEWKRLEVVERQRVDRDWMRVALRGALSMACQELRDATPPPSSVIIGGDASLDGEARAAVTSDAFGSVEVPGPLSAATTGADPLLTIQRAVIRAEQLVRKPIVITGVAMLVDGTPSLSVMERQPFSIWVSLTHYEKMPDVSVNLNIVRSDGTYVFYQPSGIDDRNINSFVGKSEVVFDFDPNPFGAGQYEVNVFACSGFSWDNIPPSEVFDRSLSNLVFNIHIARPISFGLVNVLVPVRINLKPDTGDHPV